MSMRFQFRKLINMEILMIKNLFKENCQNSIKAF